MVEPLTPTSKATSQARDVAFKILCPPKFSPIDFLVDCTYKDGSTGGEMSSLGSHGATAVVFAVIALLIIAARVAHVRIYRACASKIFQAMPWNVWQTYDELVGLAPWYPKRYVELAIWGLKAHGFIETDVDPRIMDDDAYRAQAITELENHKTPLSIFIYRRTKHPKGKRKRLRFKLPSFGWLGGPILAPGLSKA
jgi:hypothetical protein